MHARSQFAKVLGVPFFDQCSYVIGAHVQLEERPQRLGEESPRVAE
jgi:hypothetical protein